MLERKIIIGLITSTEYLQKVRPVWDAMLLESSTARLISNWCTSHYDQYKKAPGKELETIFFQKAESLDQDVAEEIEEEILPELSEEYTSSGIDLDYLVPETLLYLKSRQFALLGQQIENTIEGKVGSNEDKLKQLEQLQADFKPISTEDDESLDLSTKESLKAFKKAFEKASDPVVTFPKQLGEFWNAQFVPGGFISFLAPEKRGKTFWLLEIAMRAAKQGKNVAFFQAGDMNEAEQLKRIGIYLNRRSNQEKYCKSHLQPTRDCIRNLLDDCDKSERESDSGPFEDRDYNAFYELSAEEYKQAYEEFYDHIPCYNCKEYNSKKLGAPWLSKIEEVTPIEADDAIKAAEKFFINKGRRFKLSTHANGTLSVNNIISILDTWQSTDDFVPHLIIIDYADLLVPSISAEFRHQQNQIWKELRKLSQTKRADTLPLIIAPTQADAQAYKTSRLELSNFSEDKRKYAHVTAMYGLNQDPKGKDKSLGLMRINEIIIREGEYSNNSEVTVLQDLRQGRPFLGSYFS